MEHHFIIADIGQSVKLTPPEKTLQDRDNQPPVDLRLRASTSPGGFACFALPAPFFPLY
jgi:hypothetical protein